MIVHGMLLIDPAARPLRGWLELDGGRIAAVREGDPPGRADVGRPDAIVCPGFIDAHVHLPQMDVVGFDRLPLLEWLEQVIFPAETCWSDPKLAAAQAIDAHRRMLACGTLGYAGFLTSHPHGLDAARAATGAIPLRAWCGQVLMDRAGPAALTGHEPRDPGGADGGRLAASVNPRFAVACSDELLARAAALADDGRLVHTHLSETVEECATVAALFPEDPHYAAVYDRHGLLRPTTLLAHGLHLSEPEWELIAARGSVVVHCPVANTFLGAGLFDLASARRHGVRLALGSDVAAGCDLAMPRVARAMIEVAKARRMAGDDGAVIPTAAEAWRAITEGNADALGWADAGRLAAGAAADLLVLAAPFPADEHLAARLIYTWDDAYVVDRILSGRRFTE